MKLKSQHLEMPEQAHMLLGQDMAVWVSAILKCRMVLDHLTNAALCCYSSMLQYTL